MVCKTSTQLFTAGNKDGHRLSGPCLYYQMLSHRSVPQFSSACSTKCSSDFYLFFLRNNMASAHLLELQGNLLFSHSSETAEGMQLSRAQLKRNYCGRGCALHISSKLEAKRRHWSNWCVCIRGLSVAQWYPSVVLRHLRFIHWQCLQILSMGSILKLAPLLI